MVSPPLTPRWLRIPRLLRSDDQDNGHGEAGGAEAGQATSIVEKLGEREEEYYTVNIEEAREVLLEAISFYDHVPPVLRIEDPGRVLFVGDTHGALDVTIEAFRVAEEENVDLIVFLGDYVDRGERGVENLHYLLKKQLESPDKVILLRGNHESPMTNYYYGFYDEVLEKLGAEMYNYYRELFRKMPYMAIIGGWLAVHGGIPCKRCLNQPENPYTLDEIEERLEAIKGGEENESPDDPLALQVLWNDPRGTIEWFLPSSRGPGIYYYGVEAWKKFLEENSLQGIIRAHEVADGVYVWLGDGSSIEPRSPMSLGDLKYSVITVFSSRYHGSSAGLLLLADGEATPFFI